MTTIGMLVDSDPKNLSAWTTTFEYFAMLTILFTGLFLIYCAVNFLFKKDKGSIS